MLGNKIFAGLLVIVGLFGQFLVAEDLSKLSTKQLKKVESCSLWIRSTTQRAERLFELWLGEENVSSFNAFKKLDKFSGLQKRYFSHISGKLSENLDELSATQLIAELLKIDSIQAQTMNIAAEIARAEYDLSISLYNIEFEIADIQNIFYLIDVECRQTKRQIKDVVKMLAFWKGEVNKIRAFVVRTKNSRKTLTSKALSLRDNQVVEILLKKRADSISNIESLIQCYREAKALQIELENVKSDYLGDKGLRSKTRQLAYFRSIVNFDLLIERAKRIQVAANKLAKSLPSSRLLVNEVRFISNKILDQREKLIHEGWMSLKQKQLNALRRWLELFASDSQCFKQAQKVAEVLEEISEPSIFKMNEILYSQVREVCNGENK